MSNFIILGDGRAWVATNGAFDAVVESISKTMQKRENEQELANWLLSQRTIYVGAGMGSIDIRELTLENQQYLIEAVKNLCQTDNLEDPLDAWSGQVNLLGQMVESYLQGEPPEALNPRMKDVVPETGQHVGPGWEAGSEDN